MDLPEERQIELHPSSSLLFESLTEPFFLQAGQTSDELVSLSLPHPSAFKATAGPTQHDGTLFFLDPHLKSLYEVQSVKSSPSSWFVGDSVMQDGTLHLLAPIHPVFLVLPLLAAKADEAGFHTLDGILTTHHFPDLLKVLSFLFPILSVLGFVDLCLCLYPFH